MVDEGAGRGRVAVRGVRRRRTAQGVELSRERIVAAAANLLERRGPDALSLRKLGAALGADPSAIYRYFSGMDDIVLAVADTLLGEVLAGVVLTGDASEDLRRLGHRVSAVYTAHPNLAMVAFCRTTRRPQEMRFGELVLDVLARAGHDVPAAVDRYRAFVDTVLSLAAQDAGWASLPEEARRADDRSWRDTYGQVLPQAHPRLHAARAVLAERMPSSSFSVALDFLVAGMLAPAAPSPAGRRQKAPTGGPVEAF